MAKESRLGVPKGERGGSAMDGHLGSLFCFVFNFFDICLFRATPAAHGGSQARGLIRAIAAGLHHSHSNARSKPRLQPTPQLMATPDPQPTERGQGLNSHPHGY